MLIVNSIVRYCHEPLAREIGQPLLTFKTLNKGTYYLFFFVLLSWFYPGFVNGHSDEYDAINAVVSSKPSLSNVTLVLKEFNVSDNTNLFDIGEIYESHNLTHKLPLFNIKKPLAHCGFCYSSYSSIS